MYIQDYGGLNNKNFPVAFTNASVFIQTWCVAEVPGDWLFRATETIDGLTVYLIMLALVRGYF